MALLRRILTLGKRSRMEREIEAELREHMQMCIDDNVAAGMGRELAERDARLRFGNLAATRERVSAEDAALGLEGVWADVRYACRQLSRNPGFACTAIFVLAMGMCASVAIFAFADALLVKPLPYQDPSRLLGLFESTPLGSQFHLSYPDYLDWKRLNHVFASVEAFDNNTYALKTATGMQRVDGAIVGAGFFRMLGTSPILGRDFRIGEDTVGAPRTMILSYAAWQQRFGKRQDVLGNSLTLDGVAYTIVGVLPEEFFFAPAGSAEFWMPIQASTKPDDRGEHGILAFARLRAGATLQSASAEMRAIQQQLAKQYPDADQGRGATVLPLTEVVVGNLRPTLVLLLGGAALLLLIASVNVCGLLLVRLQGRQQEIAVRGALGASRARLIRQFITEAVSLTLTAGLISLGSAYGAIHLLRELIPLNLLHAMPYLATTGLNAHVLMFAGAIELASSTLISLVAILRAPMANLRPGLAEGSRGAVGNVWRRLGSNLVVVEICIATVLLAGAGLLCKSFYWLLHSDIGIQPDHLATLRVGLPPRKYLKDDQVIALAHRLTAEVTALPGVQSVAVAHQLPVANIAAGNITFEIMGRPDKQEGNEASSRTVSVGFFHTLGARLYEGRRFEDTDDLSSPHVAIVNRTFAKKYFAGQGALGKMLQYDSSLPPMKIVGVVEDLKEGPLDAEVQPTIYTPFDQGPDQTFYVVARTTQAPQALLGSLDKTVHHLDPEILSLTAETMDDRIHHLQSMYLHRSSAWLVSSFAAIALVLSVIGLYGVIAYSVTQRTREIGVRMALGAQRNSIYRLILTEAGYLIVFGIGLGLLGAIGAAILMSQLLFGTRPWDGATLGCVAALLTISAALASFIPAHRAAAIEPAEALRAE